MNMVELGGSAHRTSEFQRRAMIGFLLFLAIASAAFSIVFSAYYIHRDHTWTRVPGKITSVEWTKERQSGRSSRTVYVVTYGYEAKTTDGNLISDQVTFEDFNGVPVKQGQSVEVLYSDNDPSKHTTIHGHREVLKFAILFGFLCPVLLVGANWTRTYGRNCK